MKKRRRADPMWRPKLPEIAKVCETCPFNPNGNGFAIMHPDYPKIVETVERIGDFPCHQTTGVKKGVDPKRLGEPGQKQCRGATLYRRGEADLPEKAVKFWRPLGLIEDEEPTK